MNVENQIWSIDKTKDWVNADAGNSFNFETDENHLLARLLPQLIQRLILHCERVYV